MIAIVTGSRHRHDRDLLTKILTENKPTLVIHGDADGIDLACMKVCRQEGIQQIRVPANWTKEGLAAGSLRNALMAVIAKFLARDLGEEVVVFAFPAPDSKGTKNMIKVAKTYRWKTEVYLEED